METKRWVRFAGILAGLAATACGPSRYDIASGPLSGKIGGQPWTVATAQTESFLSTAEQLSVTMYADSFPACTGTSAGGNRFMIGLPTQPSDDALGSTTATFYVADTNHNLVATQGRVKVDAITATAITGGLTVEFDGDNYVSGLFEATICP